MKIKKASELEKGSNFSALIYAPPGTGKTSTIKYSKGFRNSRDLINSFIDGSSDEHQFQLKLLDKTNFWKLIFGIGGASAAIYTIIMEAIKLIK